MARCVCQGPNSLAPPYFRTFTYLNGTPRCSYYELDESERARDGFRAASKKQIGAYLEALSATLKSLQEHPDLIHLNSGVAATVDNLRLAQRDEVLAMPLQREARNTFFETLQAELELAFDIEGGEEEEGRPAFLVVLKGIGQKVRGFGVSVTYFSWTLHLPNVGVCERSVFIIYIQTLLFLLELRPA